MNNKVLVAELVDFYWELDATIEEFIFDGMDGGDVARLKDHQIKLDKILTNVSKRWAKGKREPKDFTVTSY